MLRLCFGRPLGQNVNFTSHKCNKDIVKKIAWII